MNTKWLNLDETEDTIPTIHKGLSRGRYPQLVFVHTTHPTDGRAKNYVYAAEIDGAEFTNPNIGWSAYEDLERGFVEFVAAQRLSDVKMHVMTKGMRMPITNPDMEASQ